MQKISLNTGIKTQLKNQNYNQKALKSLSLAENSLISRVDVGNNDQINFVDKIKREIQYENFQDYQEKRQSDDSQPLSYADQLLQTLIDCDCQVEQTFDEDY